MFAHIDADSIIYAAGFAAEGKDENGDKLVQPVAHALHNTKLTINNILAAVEPEHGDLEYRVYLSGPDNYRYAIAETKPYKGNRDAEHKPVHGKAIKEYLEKKHPVVYSVDEEADDLVGRTHYAMWEAGKDSIICSIDKDLDMIPGWHLNFYDSADMKLYYVEPNLADYNFYKQMLTGDTADNIQGIPRIGPKKAEKILEKSETVEEMFNAIVPMYRKSYGEKWKDVLIEHGRLLWIRRKENEWWSPPLLLDGL